MSQIELAGDDLSPSYVSLIEAGKRQPSTETLRLLAHRLGCTVEALEGTPGDSRRLGELEIAYAKLALGHGEAASARDRLLALLAKPGLDQATEDEAAFLLAQAHDKTNDLPGAAKVLLPLYERCLAGTSGLPLAVVAVVLCGYYLEAGDINAAVRVGERGLQEVAARGLEGTDDHLRLAATLMWAYFEIGDHLHCSAWAEQLHEIAARSGAPAGQAAIFWNAAVVAEAQGRADEALHLSHRALALMSELGTVRDLPRLRVDSAWFLLRSQPEQARQAADILDRALPELQDLGSPIDLARWESVRALADLMLGLPREAEHLARQALLHLSANPGVECARALVTLGDSLMAQSRHEEAIQQYHAASQALRDVYASRRTALAWREIADRLELAGQHHEAVRLYREALDAAGIRGHMHAAKVAFGLLNIDRERELSNFSLATEAGS